MEKVTMIDRIKNIMHDKNISQVELAKLCKTTQSSLSPALSGKRKIGEKFGRNIASALGVSYNWLLYGEGKMLADDEAVANTDAIPEYDIDFSCGNAVMYADGSAPIVGSVRMPEYAGASAIVRATGSSMHPLISSGDKVIVKEIHNWAENIIYGQIYGIETEGGVRTIKRIRRAKEQGTIILEPINKAEFDDTPIRADTITKMWLVMGCIKQFV